MESILGYAVSILAFAFIIFTGYCAIRESSVTGTYKAFGVYGRFYAYFAGGLFLSGICGLIGGILPIFSEEGFDFLGFLGSLLYCAFCCGISYYMYIRAKSNCPEFLQKKLLISMIITALGVGAKVCFFFFGAIWSITGPRTVTDSTGRELLVYDGEVYTPDGRHVGSCTGYNEFVPNREYNY